MRAQVGMLRDGRRLHLHDGPVDLIIEAFGTRAAVHDAYQAAIIRFQSVLDELCSELALLRAPAEGRAEMPKGRIARRMAIAVVPYAARTFITAMAAVAGAVAEEILDSMTAAADLSKAYVNDGGDIALHLSPGTAFSVGMINRPDQPSLFGAAVLHASDPVRGIATSGWRGRSFSLGIADAVTVLACTASAADAAATIIANAVDLPGSSKIQRVPARAVAPDSDLCDRLVTQSVEELSPDEIEFALDRGITVADQLRAERLIESAVLHLQGETRIVSTKQEFAPRPDKVFGSFAHA
ncbi:MAG: UPF0280 family protein [Acidobacteriaceae bacterium]|nr:UPF0280 family protein [Acidobacteriaceae bacterium]